MARPGGKGAPTDEIDRIRAHRAAEETTMRAAWEMERANAMANPFGAERAAARAWRGAIADMQRADKIEARYTGGKPARDALLNRANALRAQVYEAQRAQERGDAKMTDARLAALQTREATAWQRFEAATKAVEPLYAQARDLRQRADTVIQDQLRAHDMTFNALRSGKVVELANAQGERAYLQAQENGPDRLDRQDMRLSAFSPGALADVRSQDVQTFLSPGSRDFMRGNMGTLRTPWINWPAQKAHFLDGGWVATGQTYNSLAETRSAILKAHQAEARAARRAAKANQSA